VSFTWRQWLGGVEFFVAFIAMLAALVTGHALAATVPALALGAMSWSLLTLEREYGGARIPLRWAWTPAAFYLLSPYVMIANELKRRVVWRGRVYTVTKGAALAAAAPSARARTPLISLPPPPAAAAR
jgi:hypothetical protein